MKGSDEEQGNKQDHQGINKQLKFSLKLKSTKLEDINEKQIVLNQLSKDQRYQQYQDYQSDQQEPQEQNKPQPITKSIELQNITVQSPLKKTINKNQKDKNQPVKSNKSVKSQTFSIKRTNSKTHLQPNSKHNNGQVQNKNSPQIKRKENSQQQQKDKEYYDFKAKDISEIKNRSLTKITEGSMIKTGQVSRKMNKPFYQQTFYITGIKQNYLLLLSDNNQVLQFPIGMFTVQGGSTNSQEMSQQVGNSNQLVKDIKIGQPIKIKLQLDYFRQQKDQKLFHSLQKNIHQEYSNKNSDEPFCKRQR